MGVCTSAPPVLLSQKAVETVKEQKSPALKQLSGSLDQPIAPVRVFRDEEEIGIALKPTRSGAIVFNVAELSLDEAAQAAQDFQATLQNGDAGKELDNLRLLESMGLEVRYSSSNPFIGKLSLKFLEVTNTKHAKHTYCKVRCEGDRSCPVYATAEKEGEEDAAVFEGSPEVIFIVLHSNAHVMFKVRDQREGGFFGTVTVAIKDIEEGSHVRPFELKDPKDASRTMATLKVAITYEYLRDTRDDGSYLGPSRVLINKRRMREGAGPFGAFNYISQVNHWLLSHDNVWNPLPATAEGAAEKSGPDSDDDEFWPGQGVERSTSSVLQTRSGNAHGQSKGAKYRHALESAKRSDVSKATDTMAESSLMEALAPHEEDGRDVARLKGELQALLLAMQERIQSLETVQEQQDSAIQDLMKGLSASTGQAEDALEAPFISGTFEYGGRAAARRKDLMKGLSASTGQAEDALEAPFISGTFEYGGRAAARRKVYLFANKAQDQRSLTDATVQFLGVFKTDKKGKLNSVPVPPRIAQQPGHYSIVGLLPEDHTFSKGMLFLLQPGTKCVIFDVDGTLTVGDIQVVTVAALDGLAINTSLAENLSHKYDLKARPHALHVVRAWAAKGYQPIYLSGRQGSYFNLTLEWLVKHAYPPGPIHLTRTHLPTLPLYYSVGNFKVAYMEALKAKGLEIYAAYGNTATDIRAYGAAGIPKERTYVVGPNGGKLDSVKIDSFTEHLPEVFKHPDSDVPIPYTELLITGTPGYKKRDAGDKSAKRNSLMGRLSRSSVAPSETVEDVDATLGASDAADVEEDDGGDDDADSDEDEVTSKAAGAPGPALAQAAIQHGEQLNSAMKQAGNSQEAAAAVLSSHP